METRQSPATDSSARPLSRDQKIWRWKVLTSTYFAYVGYYFARKGYGVLKKPIGDEFGLDASALAHVWSVFLITYMIGQFVNGAADIEVVLGLDDGHVRVDDIRVARSSPIP